MTAPGPSSSRLARWPGAIALADPAAARWLLAVVLTWAWFIDAPAWNQNSRLALTRALVERASVAIDPDAHTTGDKSSVGGRIYCDKAPGVSWLGVVGYGPVYWARRALDLPGPGVELDATLAEYLEVPPDDLEAIARAVERARDCDRVAPGAPCLGLPGEPWPRAPEALVWRYDANFSLAMYAARLAAVTIPSALAAAAWFALVAWLLGHRPGAPLDPRIRAGAGAVVGTWLLATPALPYATALYGHQACAAALALAGALWLLPAPREAGGVALGFGTALAWAVLFEYTAAPLAVVGWIAATTQRGLGFGLRAGAAALPWAVALAAYHSAAFGAPWSTGYAHLVRPEFAEGMAVAYGLGPPRLDVLAELLVGRERGLTWAAPVTILGLAGWLGGWWRAPLGPAGSGPGEPERRAATRVAALAGALVTAYGLALASGYYMWDGGAAFGPRHALFVLPWLCLGLLAFAGGRSTLLWPALAALSAAYALVVTACGPELPQGVDPLWGHAIGRFVLALVEPGQAALRPTLGSQLGIPGAWSVAPLAVVWAWALWPGSERPHPGGATPPG